MWETVIRSVVAYLIPLLAGYAISMFGLGRRVRNLECDLASGAEERKRVLKSLLACLYGLQELRCDGPVTEGIRDLETWLYDSAHTLKSGG